MNRPCAVCRRPVGPTEREWCVVRSASVCLACLAAEAAATSRARQAAEPTPDPGDLPVPPLPSRLAQRLERQVRAAAATTN